jgi:hypothetical protein
MELSNFNLFHDIHQLYQHSTYHAIEIYLFRFALVCELPFWPSSLFRFPLSRAGLSALDVWRS